MPYIGACATKKHAPLWSGKKRMIDSAARAGRWRNGPTAIAVHRRAAYGARPATYLQQDYKNPPAAPVYTNIPQNPFNPISHKVHDPQPSLL
jgi:hypothetical protein